MEQNFGTASSSIFAQSLTYSQSFASGTGPLRNINVSLNNGGQQVAQLGSMEAESLSNNSLGTSQYLSELKKLKDRKEALLRSKGYTTEESSQFEDQYSNFKVPASRPVALTHGQSLESFQTQRLAFNNSLEKVAGKEQQTITTSQGSNESNSGRSPSHSVKFMLPTHGMVPQMAVMTTNRTEESQERAGDNTEFVIEDMAVAQRERITSQDSNSNGTNNFYPPRIDELNEEQESMNESLIDMHQVKHTAGRSLETEEEDQNDVSLSVVDHLSNDEAIDFWRRYFSEYGHQQVGLEAFCEAIHAEFNIMVFKKILEEHPPNFQDDLMSDFFADLANKVSLDQEFVSLNAFEIFSRSKGLERSIKSLMEDVAMRHKAQRSIRLNDTIVAELADVKELLDLKSKQIAQREADLKKRENALTKQKLEAAKELEQMYKKKVQETEAKYIKASNNLQKKINTVERNFNNKLKLLRSKAADEQSISLQSSALKQSKISDKSNVSSEQIKVLKARVQNLEKAYEVLKHKNGKTEEEKALLIAENSKLQEDLIKVKQQKQRLLQKELSAQKSHKEEEEKKKPARLTVSDLDHHKDAPTKQDKSSTLTEKPDSTGLASIKFTCQVLSTLSQTVPLFLKRDAPLDESYCSQIENPSVSMGDLLFPAFNSLIPSMVENAMPVISTLNNQEVSVLIDTFYHMLEFAFRTQIFEKQVPNFMIISAKSKAENTLTRLLQSSTSDSDLRPVCLDSKFRSKSFQLRRSEQLKKGSKSSANYLPLYPLFKDNVVHQLLCDDFSKLTAPTKKEAALTTTQRIKVALIKIMLASQFSEVSDALQVIKTLLQGPSTEDEAHQALLVETQSLPVLSLTLLMPELTSMTITLLLAMSFSEKFADTFTTMLIQPSTFQVYQHSMMGAMQIGSSLVDDFVVILQKATSRDAGALAGLIDGHLIEALHNLLELPENSSFQKQNIKSILRNITLE